MQPAPPQRFPFNPEPYTDDKRKNLEHNIDAINEFLTDNGLVADQVKMSVSTLRSLFPYIQKYSAKWASFDPSHLTTQNREVRRLLD
mgnify:CR=1 FL=1